MFFDFSVIFVVAVVVMNNKQRKPKKLVNFAKNCKFTFLFLQKKVSYLNFAICCLLNKTDYYNLI